MSAMNSWIFPTDYHLRPTLYTERVVPSFVGTRYVYSAKFLYAVNKTTSVNVLNMSSETVTICERAVAASRQVDRPGLVGADVFDTLLPNQALNITLDRLASLLGVPPSPDGFEGVVEIESPMDVLQVTSVYEDLRNSLAICLTWGATPSDLDAHLLTPTIGETPFHVYFAYKGSVVAPPFASLDYDDVDSFGPETITVSRLKQGVYQYYVHDWTQTTGVQRSGARVKLVDPYGNVVKTYWPTNSGRSLFWHVFDLWVYYDGATPLVIDVNEYSDTPPGVASVSDAPLPLEPSAKPALTMPEPL